MTVIAHKPIDFFGHNFVRVMTQDEHGEIIDTICYKGEPVAQGDKFVYTLAIQNVIRGPLELCDRVDRLHNRPVGRQ